MFFEGGSLDLVENVFLLLLFFCEILIEDIRDFIGFADFSEFGSYCEIMGIEQWENDTTILWAS